MKKYNDDTYLLLIFLLNIKEGYYIPPLSISLTFLATTYSLCLTSLAIPVLFMASYLCNISSISSQHISLINESTSNPLAT